MLTCYACYLLFFCSPILPNKWTSKHIIIVVYLLTHDTDKLVNFCDQLEQAADSYEKPKTDKDRIPQKRKRESSQWCQICHMNNHLTKECSWLNKARDLKTKPSTK